VKAGGVFVKVVKPDTGYTALFNSANPNNGMLSSEAAGALLLKSGLESSALHGLWADAKAGGPKTCATDQMDLAEFLIACELAVKAGGVFVKVVKPDTGYTALFNSANPADGLLSSKDAGALLLTSGLESSALSELWVNAKAAGPKTCATDHMDLAEFLIACELAVKAGGVFATTGAPTKAASNPNYIDSLGTTLALNAAATAVSGKVDPLVRSLSSLNPNCCAH
jgi:hypothetical protein